MLSCIVLLVISTKLNYYFKLIITFISSKNVLLLLYYIGFTYIYSLISLYAVLAFVLLGGIIINKYVYIYMRVYVFVYIYI